MQILPLDGVWEVRGFDPHGTRRITGLHGTVPGQVHADLQRAGLIPDEVGALLQEGLNTLEVRFSVHYARTRCLNC